MGRCICGGLNGGVTSFQNASLVALQAPDHSDESSYLASGTFAFMLTNDNALDFSIAQKV